MTPNDTLLKSPNSKQYGSVVTPLSVPIDNGHEHEERGTTIWCMRISQQKLSVLIAVMAVIANIGFYIIVPIYLTDLVQAGSDPLVLTVMSNISCMFAFTVMAVIQWCYTRNLPCLHPYTKYGSAALFGLVAKSHDILLAFASLPTRTRPQLLGILSAAMLPNTLICRFVILRIGIQTKHGDNDTVSEMDKTVVYSWIWPLLVVGSTLLLAISIVILEREIKSPEVSLIAFVFWGEIFKCLSLAVLFWTTLIPNFGMANDIGEFLTSLWRGLYCSFSNDPSCNGCLAKGSASHSYQRVPVRSPSKYAEGAVYTTINKSVSIPLSTLFWTLFVDTAVFGLLWRPQLNINTILVFAGILLVIPATCLYSYFSNREALSTDTKENITREK